MSKTVGFYIHVGETNAVPAANETRHRHLPENITA